MPYIKRDTTGAIADIYERPSSEAMEFLDSEDPEIARYLARGQSDVGIRGQLTGSDVDMARVVEDLIEVLLRRGVIRAADFPEAVHLKLRRRRALRQTMSQLNKLVGEE